VANCGSPSKTTRPWSSTTPRSQISSTRLSEWVTNRIGPALALELGDLVQALAGEGLVADGEHLVHEQDVRIDVHRDGEAEPDVHARTSSA
jgi:hypothetical protein